MSEQYGKVTKAVIPVAGFGTRMLPASKAIPKELLPVVDRPAIQYVVEEAAAAGITDIILVTHAAKTAIEDHFDCQHELEETLRAKNKMRLLAEVQNALPQGVRLSSVRQGGALGLGHAVACAASLVGDAPFAVLLPDVLVDSDKEACDLAAMVQMFAQSGRAQVMVEAVPTERVSQYGIVALDGALERPGHSAAITDIVEKPAPDKAPSNLAVVGRYVFPPSIFALLQQTRPGQGGEIQLTDGIAALLAQGVDAWRMTGLTFDCGNKAGYLEAVLHFGLKHPEVGEDLRHTMTRLLDQTSSR